ncbi:MAG: DUF6531 domain-containing protein, partial [Hafnia sp.]
MAKGPSISGKVIKDFEEEVSVFKTAVEDTKHVENSKNAATTEAKISGHDVQNPERINNMSFNQGYEAAHQVLLDEKQPLGGKGGHGPDGQSSQSGGNTTTDGDPVSMMSGEELLTLTDGTLPGWLPFVWQRCYRSSAASQNG